MLTDNEVDSHPIDSAAADSSVVVYHPEYFVSFHLQFAYSIPPI